MNRALKSIAAWLVLGLAGTSGFANDAVHHCGAIATAACSRTRAKRAASSSTPSLADRIGAARAGVREEDRGEGRDFRTISEKVVQRAVTEARAWRFAVDVIETNGPEMEIMAREKLFSDFHRPTFADLPASAIPSHGQWIPDRVNFSSWPTTPLR